MFHKKPSTRKDKTNGGISEGYRLKEIHNLDLSVETNVGGWEKIDASKEDRIFYVIKGTGFARVNGKHSRIDEGDLIEVAMGQEAELNGQYKLLSIKPKV
jgi:hypothetical protein